MAGSFSGSNSTQCLALQHGPGTLAAMFSGDPHGSGEVSPGHLKVVASDNDQQTNIAIEQWPSRNCIK